MTGKKEELTNSDSGSDLTIYAEGLWAILREQNEVRKLNMEDAELARVVFDDVEDIEPPSVGDDAVVLDVFRMFHFMVGYLTAYAYGKGRLPESLLMEFAQGGEDAA